MPVDNRYVCRMPVSLTSALLCILFLVGCSEGDRADDDVLNAAYQYTDGGGYKWDKFTGSGCPERVEFRGVTLVEPADAGTYCNGFTFVVVMRVARDRGLLDELYIDDMNTFKRQWYASTPDLAEQGSARALDNLGIGYMVDPEDARPGDFIYFQRPRSHSAHSAIFLGWIEAYGSKIGIRYRSSQPSTNGIGDTSEFFELNDIPTGSIPWDRFYVARMNPGKSR